ncbi:hypothetical protein EX059_24185 [Salmonella enterica]|nr:hypothetical protein [Salmonella enterica]EEL5633142.1 hypothetical protein [Salmonella enterica subsp. enterica serovar Derby]EAQ0727587.1 hypothetical protein [Salmonella enterica]ECO5069043.1 hypothetical protein [Salmonella enterica]ECY0828673.1 hypothetical protein [Salmonella enterica]
MSSTDRYSLHGQPGTEIAPCRRKAENLKFDKAAGSYFLRVQTNKGLADDRKEKRVSPTGETLF